LLDAFEELLVPRDVAVELSDSGIVPSNYPLAGLVIAIPVVGKVWSVAVPITHWRIDGLRIWNKPV